MRHMNVQHMTESTINRLDIIWRAMLAGVVALAGATFFFSDMIPVNPITRDANAEQVKLIMFLLMIIMSVMDIAFAYAFGRFFKNPTLLKKFIDSKGAGTMPPDEIAGILINRYFTMNIIRLALVESLVLYGAIPCFMFGAQSVTYAFYALTALFLIIFRPDSTELENMIKTARM